MIRRIIKIIIIIKILRGIIIKCNKIRRYRDKKVKITIIPSQNTIPLIKLIIADC